MPADVIVMALVLTVVVPAPAKVRLLAPAAMPPVSANVSLELTASIVAAPASVIVPAYEFAPPVALSARGRTARVVAAGGPARAVDRQRNVADRDSVLQSQRRRCRRSRPTMCPARNSVAKSARRR